MAKDTLKIVSAQINSSVNNFQANLNKMRDVYLKAKAQGADLVVFPELSITGYPLEDSVQQPDLLKQSKKALKLLQKMSEQGDPGILVGLPQRDKKGRIYNTSVLLHKGKKKGEVRKVALPNHDVFDEKRNYSAGTFTKPIKFKGHKLGVLICEDIWTPDVAAQLKEKGAKALISMNASPFEVGKVEKRIHEVVGKRIDETGLPVLYVNQVGGQDEVVFDGHSFALNRNGKLVYFAQGFKETSDTLSLVFNKKGKAKFENGSVAWVPGQGYDEDNKELEQVWQALVLAVRDYFAKTGFEKAILGMSGGIDSAVVAALAVDALGPDKVRLYRLPSKHTSDMSNDDADEAAKMMGCEIGQLPIKEVHSVIAALLKDRFDAARLDGREGRLQVTDENIQARVRGILLMALSNAGEGLLLTTGNKSEISVGYFTMYGDASGGYAPIRDVWKTDVYRLAAWRNSHFPNGALGPNGKVMPENIITRPPSAELADGQEDTDSLPPYEVLDPILKAYMEEDKGLEEISDVNAQPLELVEGVVRLVSSAEHKRRQAPLGPKIRKRSFGKGWRQPLAQPSLPDALCKLKI